MAPGQPKATTRDGPEGFEIVVPAPRNVFLLGFLAIWMVGWTVGWVSGFAQLLSGTGGVGVDLFMLVWLTVWTLGGAFAGAVLAWGLAGRETVRLETRALVVRRSVFGLGRSREYDLPHVARLRVAPEGFNPFDFRSGLRFWGLGGGPLAFDYGASTVRVGAGVEEAEAQALRDELVRRVPSLGEPEDA